MLPLVWLAIFFGYMVALWEAGAHLRGVSTLLYTLLAWTFGHIGTMWLNAARDQDRGPVAFGRTVGVPPHTALCGLAAIGATVICAVPAGPVITTCALGICGLSLLYNHPQAAWKGHPVGGPLVNIIGYGFLTPLAGLVAGHGMVGPRTVALFTIMGLSTASLYFGAQAFQQDEDQSRRDRTLVATHGPVTVLRVARTCLRVAGMLALAGTVFGWFPRACLVAAPLAWWVDRHLVRWQTQPGGGSPADVRTFLFRLLSLLLVLVLAAMTEHIGDMLHGERPAGRNTAVVPPAWFVLEPDGLVARTAS